MQSRVIPRAPFIHNGRVWRYNPLYPDNGLPYYNQLVFLTTCDDQGTRTVNLNEWFFNQMYMMSGTMLECCWVVGSKGILAQ